MVYSFTIDDMSVNCHWEYGKAETYKFWDSLIHFHFMHEVHFILENEVTFVVGNEKHQLKKGDACIIPANLMHYPIIQDPTMPRISFFITLNKIKEEGDAFEYFSKILSHQDAIIVRNNEKAQEYLTSFLSKANGEAVIANHKARAYLELFFLELCDSITEIQEKTREYGQKDEEYASLKIKIDNFVSRKYMEEISIDDLANTIGYSKSQTSRIVMKITGKTFPEFLTCWRMEVAKMLILNTEQSLTKIAEKVGYQTYAGFYKGFKSVYGISPQTVKISKNKK